MNLPRTVIASPPAKGVSFKSTTNPETTIPDPVITLRSGREDSLLRHHPWLFSGAVFKESAGLPPGDTVVIATTDGNPLATGAYSPSSSIRVRVWSFDPGEPIDDAFFRRRLERSIAGRRALMENESVTSCRLVNAESDGLPGVIADKYGDFLVCQFLSAGAEKWREVIVRELTAILAPAGIYERSDADVREKEGLNPRTGVLAGAEPPELLEIREGTVRYLVDVRRGHKTGFYLDQRENRAAVAEWAAGAEVLNCFSYTGGFGIAAAAAGASRVVDIDSAADVLDLAARNTALNGFDEEKIEHVRGNVFQVLRGYRDAARAFDLIVLDPPKFVPSASRLATGSRGYKDINLLAFKLLRPGGILMTFSCSGVLDAGLFQKIVADAALDAGRDALAIRFLGQAGDHPVTLNFPEGRYLKGLVCRVW